MATEAKKMRIMENAQLHGGSPGLSMYAGRVKADSTKEVVISVPCYSVQAAIVTQGTAVLAPTISSDGGTTTVTVTSGAATEIHFLIIGNAQNEMTVPDYGDAASTTIRPTL